MAPCPRNPAARIYPIVFIRHAIDAIAEPVEGDRVDVDFKTRWIHENKVRWGTAWPDCEFSRSQDLAKPRDIGEADDDVDVFVRSRLIFEQRIDTPAAVDPHLYSDAFEDVQ